MWYHMLFPSQKDSYHVFLFYKASRMKVSNLTELFSHLNALGSKFELDEK